MSHHIPWVPSDDLICDRSFAGILLSSCKFLCSGLRSDLLGCLEMLSKELPQNGVPTGLSLRHAPFDGTGTPSWKVKERLGHIFYVLNEQGGIPDYHSRYLKIRHMIASWDFDDACLVQTLMMQGISFQDPDVKNGQWQFEGGLDERRWTIVNPFADLSKYETCYREPPPQEPNKQEQLSDDEMLEAALAAEAVGRQRQGFFFMLHMHVTPYYFSTQFML